jgi:tight adherence protein B
MDIIVRGVRTGLPLGDCLKIIAHESPDPLGTEFRRVVEGEGLGIPIEVCLEQLHERMPISEVNFFATVLNIQKTTGGNLGESLANLSNVLRGRKLLREKIKALSAEAKMSAIIIGALPIVVMTLVTIASPEYMSELYTTPTGHRNMMIGAGMMVLGTLMMRKMINFKF